MKNEEGQAYYNETMPAHGPRNGRLIAAAPDLEAALKGLVAEIEDYVFRTGQINMLEHELAAARAALAKAGGTDGPRAG